MSRRVLPLIGVIAIASTLAAAPAFAEPAAPPAPPINWQPCAEKPEAECGTVEVPVDWSKPNGATIQMAVVRRKAGSPEQRIGSLLYLQGGPGVSGVSTVLNAVPFSPEIAAKFDIVSFDARGVARSAGVRCDMELLRDMPEFVPDGTPEQFERVRGYVKRLGDSCRQHSGALLDNLDTASVANDIDVLRAGLGEEQVSLFGFSYGTLTGQMYAERFPNRVRALLLDSVVDHSLDTEEFVTTGAASAEDSFNAFVKWCADTQSCALHGEDLPALFDTLYERAKRGELHRPGSNEKMTQTALSEIVTRGGYGPVWPSMATYLTRLRDGGTADVAARSQETLPDKQKTSPDETALFCADWNTRIDSARHFQELWDRQEKAAPHLRYSMLWKFASLCAFWPAETKNPQHKPRLHGPAPVLIMNALHDPVSGYNWATNVDRQVRSAELLTYDGGGHGVYARNQCTLRAADRYLVELTMPKPDTHCPAVPPEQQGSTPMSQMASGR
ncbi:alpha/beta hydrolase [Crossiella cryophila]|uniref:Pimeloyl-ACP methyl ester carboxylesterase n=1 Tax=Crossiella cryophila TaxID=43355 RepID=A0A7W7CEX6_9PSEU|nr:alpha/beta hydrolase [Crossiella cryophila]MBB4679904.1 pimeloyl-ACP methyl ester carboxylesterase [Crossiella cryophila]